MRSAKLTLLFACKLVGLFYLARRLTRNRLKILCYHGFELQDESAFRPKLFIKPARFERRLRTIKRLGFNVLSLDEAIERLYSGMLPEDALVITVDDGFHSFSHIAVPCLKRYGFPATVYVTTYYVQNKNPIFGLVVQYMFWKTRRREVTLRGVCWSSHDRNVNLVEPADAADAMWTCINYGEQRCSEVQRRQICEQLGALLEVPYADILQARILQLMSPEELGALSSADVSVELHTHRHTFSGDDPIAAEREIADNRAALQQWLPGERRHFCYPSGLWEERQWDWLDHMRVKSSTTCIPGLNSRETPHHALKRFLDGDNIHHLEFEAALSGFSDLMRNWFAPASRP